MGVIGCVLCIRKKDTESEVEGESSVGGTVHHCAWASLLYLTFTFSDGLGACLGAVCGTT